MLKRIFHIAFTAVLALNITGAAAFSYAADCGMECCRPADWAGTVSFEAPSCCDMDGVTCGFETGRLEDPFDTALTCSGSKNPANSIFDNLFSAAGFYAPAHSRTFLSTPLPTGSPPTVPVYLSNSAILC